MSCTILTVPFDLVENEKGEFLKKGFVVDQQLQKIFGNSIHHKGYLYSLQFEGICVYKAILKTFLRQKSTHFNIHAKLKSNYSFGDRKKYANTIDSHCIKKLEPNTFPKPEIDYLGKLLTELDEKNDLRFRTKLKNAKNQFFTIESVSVFINRQNSAKGVGYGFISVALSWQNEIGQRTAIPELSAVREFLRYFSAENEKNTFVPIFHGTIRTGETSSKAITSNAEDQINYLKSKLPRLKTEHPEVFDSVEVPEDAYQKSHVNFFSLFDELLKSFLPSSTQETSFYKFKDDIKPYLLHLDEARNFTSENERDIWMKSIYHVLRIPGQERMPIFNEFNYSPIMADDSTLFYCLNEGAYIMDGSHAKADKAMVNVYFPAFLMALNQKYLFDYFQCKISDLSLNKKNRYKERELKRLKANLVKTEFRQVFFHVSNYHEVSEFYHAVQSKFKIKELRDEYVTSIEAINELVKLTQDGRLNTILLALTIYQVWFGICDIYPVKNIMWVPLLGLLVITAGFLAYTMARGTSSFRFNLKIKNPK
jgi:hypothetical protein